MDLWYRFVFNDGETFDYSGNEKSMEKEIKKFSEKDYQGYQKLVKFTEKPDFVREYIADAILSLRYPFLLIHL